MCVGWAEGVRGEERVLATIRNPKVIQRDCSARAMEVQAGRRRRPEAVDPTATTLVALLETLQVENSAPPPNPNLPLRTLRAAALAIYTTAAAAHPDQPANRACRDRPAEKGRKFCKLHQKPLLELGVRGGAVVLWAYALADTEVAACLQSDCSRAAIHIAA